MSKYVDKLTVEDFLASRRRLAQRLRQCRNAWNELLDDCTAEGVKVERAMTLMLKFKSRDATALLKKVREDYRTRFYNTKPTVGNLIKLREEARRMFEFWDDRIKSSSYVMDDGYSLCGLSDYHGEIRDGYQKDIYSLTALIVRIKQGKEPAI